MSKGPTVTTLHRENKVLMQLDINISKLINMYNNDRNLSSVEIAGVLGAIQQRLYLGQPLIIEDDTQ